ncbi:hypothetical protein [Nocardioides gilvus]|uniref:hypothetical protein n=1 Tax=Nocardioides gilvus TaxID=1735589 RepID=UPI000D74595B|nr:hypothetical protein [Nocardioides gilvus]
MAEVQRREDLLEAQRYRRTQAAHAVFAVGRAHATYTGPGPWAGPVLGLLVAGVLCAAGPVIDVVTQTPPTSAPVAPVTPPIPPEAREQDAHGQDGEDAPH